MSGRIPHRHWCGQACYPGKERFIFGSVVLPTSAQQHEIDVALVELWHSMIPLDPPPFVAIPGMIYFVGEDE